MCSRKVAILDPYIFDTHVLMHIGSFQQVFVANPNKNKPILDILTKNQERLIVFLSNFHNDRHGKKKKP